MLSLQLIREQTELVRAGLAKKHETAPIDEILALDERRRALLQEVGSLRARRNEVSKEIGRMKEKPPALIEEMRRVSDRIKELDAESNAVQAQLDDLLLRVPNLPAPDVPVGKDESENVVLRQWGEPRRFDFDPLPHWEIARQLGIIDLDAGAKIAGSGFIVYRGLGARLERSLVNFFIDLHTSAHGYTEIFPPFLASRASMTGSGQLPKFEEDAYRIERDDLFLIPTAEVPLCNLHRNEILEGRLLPLNYCAYSPCFRREAGAAGRETRGLLRVHEFNKVELVKYTTPETSYEELERLTGHAERMLQLLEIPYQVIQMCTGDLGFAAAKKYDLNAWAGGVGRWLEVSSCSNDEDFQARRANVRFRREPGARPEYVHTLNGSGVALARTVVCILENYQEADGSVRVPKVLQPYVGTDLMRA